MKIKRVLLFVFIGFVVFSAGSAIFHKPYYANVIKGVYALSFRDTIQWVRYYKDDLGPGVETKFQHRDTPYCFSGSSTMVKDVYFDFARNGDVLLKARNTDTFYVVRGGNNFSFILSECR